MQHKQLSNFHLAEQLDFAKIYLNESKSILLVQYLQGTLVDAYKGQQVIDAVYPYIANGALLGMTDATAKNINITSETRKLYSSNKSMNATIAHAVVLKDLHIRMLANLFIKFDKPNVPTKVFNNFQKAVDYLERLAVPETAEENSSKVPSL